jgi:hypothetical protein
MRIKITQMASLNAEEEHQFEQRNLLRLRRYFHEKFASLSDDEILAFIRHCVRRAEDYGISNDHDISLYIGVAARWGRDFDRNGACPWATQILVNRSLDSRTKVVGLYMHMEID